MRRHLVPDWRAVSERYDGVHLSWAGFITSEGCITDLDGGDVTMLRYWFSERTNWLADVFGEPEPLPAPWLPYDTLVGADVTTDEGRRTRPRRAHPPARPVTQQPPVRYRPPTGPAGR